jgi:peptidoglycan/LPS O-acetylase OafA/YrhL
MPDHAAFPALDGVRAVAVAAVVATHAAFWTGRYVKGPFSPLLARLDSGVAIFFVLSGFLLIRPWLVAARDGGSMPSPRVYFWRRALRILPLYWVTVAIALTLLVQWPRLTSADWLHHVFLLQIYRFGWLRGGLTQTWSLCTEVSFYLVLPAIGGLAVWWTRRRGWRPGELLIGCLALVVVSAVWPFVIYHKSWGLAWQANLWLPAYLSWFAGGIALAVLATQVNTDGESRRLHAAMSVARSVPGCWWAAAIAVFAIAMTPVAGPLGLSTSATNAAAATRNLLYLALAVAAVFPALFCVDSAGYRFLASPVMRRLGEISYGVFLLHLVILEGVMNLMGYRVFSGSFIVVFVVTGVASAAAATVSFRWIEQPTMRLRRMVQPRPLTRRQPGHRVGTPTSSAP